MSNRYLVPHLEDYETLRDRVAACFDLSRRYPSSAFLVSHPRTVFIEYEVAISGDFWPALSRLASIHGDDCVEFITVDPAPGDDYLPLNSGSYPAFSMSVRASSDAYRDAVMEHLPGDKWEFIMLLSSVIAITGSSASWGCWGERDIGVTAIQGSGPEFDQWVADNGPFWSAHEALDGVISLNFRSGVVTSDFRDTFLASY